MVIQEGTNYSSRFVNKVKNKNIFDFILNFIDNNKLVEKKYEHLMGKYCYYNTTYTSYTLKLNDIIHANILEDERAVRLNTFKSKYISILSLEYLFYRFQILFRFPLYRFHKSLNTKSLGICYKIEQKYIYVKPTFKELLLNDDIEIVGIAGDETPLWYPFYHRDKKEMDETTFNILASKNLIRKEVKV